MSKNKGNRPGSAAVSTIPENVKRPADHQTASRDVTPEDTTVEWKGHEYTLTDDAKNDFEVLELLDDVESNPARFPKLLRALLGPEQFDTWKENSRGENGRVSTTDAGEFFRFLMGEANKGNS